MRHVTKTVYQFLELSPKAQAKAIDDNRLINVDDSDWDSCDLEFWVTLLDSIGFTGANIRYSGFGSQWDGASFESGIDLPRLASIMASPPEPSESAGNESREELAAYVGHKLGGWPASEERLWAWFAALSPVTAGDWFSASIDRGTSRYCHWNTCSVTLETERDSEELGDVLNELQADIESLRRGLCRAIYASLQTSYDSLTEDDSVSDTLEANGYEFDQFGQIYNDDESGACHG